jgi:hypothetical protein
MRRYSKMMKGKVSCVVWRASYKVYLHSFAQQTLPKMRKKKKKSKKKKKRRMCPSASNAGALVAVRITRRPLPMAALPTATPPRPQNRTTLEPPRLPNRTTLEQRQRKGGHPGEVQRYWVLSKPQKGQEGATTATRRCAARCFSRRCSCFVILFLSPFASSLRRRRKSMSSLRAEARADVPHLLPPPRPPPLLLLRFEPHPLAPQESRLVLHPHRFPNPPLPLKRLSKTREQRDPGVDRQQAAALHPLRTRVYTIKQTAHRSSLSRLLCFARSCALHPPAIALLMLAKGEVLQRGVAQVDDGVEVFFCRVAVGRLCGRS